MDEEKARFRDKLLATEAKKMASGLPRLWKTGLGAAGAATAVLGGRFRGREKGLEAADFNAVTRLVERLGELKGVAMKAGQILGYIDPSLSPELRSLLSVLQTAAPASPFAEVEQTIRSAFGSRADELLDALERTPMAVASIGQVHRAKWPLNAEVAVKVRHAGIEAALASDFKAAGFGSALATSIFNVAGGSVSSFVEEARTALMEECDYKLEATRQQTFARLFYNDPDIVIPPVVLDWCGDGVLTTGFCPGLSLEDWLATHPEASARNRLGEALFRFYVGTLYQHGLFHADPHPGNYALADDGRVVIYDFGCVRKFDHAMVRSFALLVSAVRDDDLNAVAGALHALGAREAPVISDQLRQLLRGFFAPLLAPGPGRIEPDAGFEAQQALKDKRAIMQLALPGKLLFLFRLRFGLYSILAQIGAEADWARMEAKWASDALTMREHG